MDPIERERVALDALTDIVQDDVADSHDRVTASSILLHHDDEVRASVEAFNRHQEIIEELRGIREVLAERVYVK